MPIIYRFELREFADEMERELRKHDPKKGDSWRTMGEVVLYEQLVDVFEKLENLDHKNPRQERSELVDLANLAMMLWHRLKEG